MTTSVIMLCGGRGDRWNDYMGITKHMVPIRGEPLIVRTCRQLRKRLSVEPWVVAGDTRITALGLRNCVDYDHRFCSAGALSTLPLWAERTFILFGDTYYDKATMDGICASQGLRAFWTDYQFCGWHWDNPADRERLERAMRAAVVEQARATDPSSPEGMGYLNRAYYIAAGLPACGREHRKNSPLVANVAGVCVDFDYPIEYTSFLKHNRPDDLP